MKDIIIYGSKNRINHNHLYLFSPCELVDIQVIDKDGEKKRSIKLITSVAKAKRRLEILGYSKKESKRYFEEGMEYFRHKYNGEDEEELYKDTQEYYKNIDFDKYIISLQSVFESEFLEIGNKDILITYLEMSTDNISKHIIEKLSKGYYLSHIFYEEIWEDEEDMINQIMDLYICLLCLQNEDEIILDITEVVESGWVELDKVDAFFCDKIEKTIIITEGKNDIKILEGSIRILFPEYEHLFVFFDFKSYRSDGGASYLVKLLKSFSAAHIKNRIITLFDNDTAATNELLQIKGIQLLDTISIMKLPELDFCMDYPTIGRTGNNNLNINGLAVSIEMFYGDDIIKREGEYQPVIWKGYFDRIKNYQGVISEKNQINRLMEKKLKSPDLKNQDWSKLDMLWQSIFNISNQ